MEYNATDMQNNIDVMTELLKQQKFEQACELKKELPYAEVEKHFGLAAVKTRINQDVELISSMPNYPRLSDLTEVSDRAFSVMTREGADDAEVVDIFFKYSFLCIYRLNALILPDKLNDEMILTLPEELRLGYYCFIASSAFDDRDIKTCINYMRKAALLDLRLRKVITSMKNVVSV